jgi:excisionase family DNA binding protein
MGMFMPHHARMELKLLYSKRESAQILSISLRTLDALIERKELAFLRIGKRVLISGQSLQEFVEKAG